VAKEPSAAVSPPGSPKEPRTTELAKQGCGKEGVEGEACMEILQAMEKKIASLEAASEEETSTNFFFYEGEMERLRDECQSLRIENQTLQGALEESQIEGESLRISLRQLQRQVEMKSNTESEQLSLGHEKELRTVKKDAEREASQAREATKMLDAEIAELKTIIGDLQCHVDVLKVEKDGFKAMQEAENERRKGAERRMREAEKKVETTRIRTLIDEAQQRENIYNQLQENNTIEASKWKQAATKEFLQRQVWAGKVLDPDPTRATKMAAAAHNGARSPR